jgi:antitoxin (DNA-binding transcriptional repressor) of toxin-antitoxin stability system
MVSMNEPEAARNFWAVMERVEAGEEFEILRDGKPIAELRPPSRPREGTTVAPRER